MATIKFWQEMRKATSVANKDKIMVGIESTGEAMYMDYEDLVSRAGQDASTGIEGVSPGALPILGSEKKSALAQPGTYTQSGGADIVVPEGSMGILFWDGSEWSLTGTVDVPVPVGVDTIDPEGEGLPKERAVADYVVSKNSALRNDLLNFQFGGTIDWETSPALTDGFYINRSGSLVSTPPTQWAATEDFLPLYGAKQLEYFGNFGGSTTSLAFYASTSEASRLLVVPETNDPISNIVVDVPVGAQYYRATCAVPAKPNFKIVLKGLTSKVLNLQTFRMVGTLTYENEAVKQSNIIWNDGSTGVITFGDWNEENLTFTSFVATSVQNEVTVTQPPVTFNSNNQITNYPNYIISTL